MDSIAFVQKLTNELWQVVYAYLEIPDLINLYRAIPGLLPSLGGYRDWGALLAREFGPRIGDLDCSFDFFAKNWRCLYSMDTKGRIAELTRSKFDHPVQTITACMLQGTDNHLYQSSNMKPTSLKTGPIAGGPGTTWCGRNIWIRDNRYHMIKCNLDFDIGYATQSGSDIYFYIPSLGIYKTCTPAKAPATITLAQLEHALKPAEPLTKLIVCTNGLVYLGKSGDIYGNAGRLRSGDFVDILKWRDGFLALTAEGTILDTNYDFVSKYNDPIRQLCGSLNVLLALGRSGHLYMLAGNITGLPVKDAFDVPGRIASVGSGLFGRLVYAIVLPKDAKLGKQSLKSKFKTGWSAAKESVPQNWVGAGLFL